MVITLLGGAFLKIEAKDHTLVLSPQESIEGKKVPRFGADIALIAKSNEACPATLLSYKDREPFCINGAGEYEIGGMYIRGVSSDTLSDGSLNSAYRVIIEGLSVVHLGSQKRAITPEVKEALGAADVLALAIGGDDGMTPEAGYKAATFLEAKLILPLFLGNKAHREKNKKLFLREAGIDDHDDVERLSLKKKDVESREGDVTILIPALVK